MAQGNKRKKRLPALERKDLIVKAAERLISEKGFKGTTTREIAKKAGISEAMIFRYFARKEDLYRAIIDRCCNSTDGTFILTKRLEGKKGREAFREIVELFMERYKDPSFARLLMFGALERREFSDMFLKTKGVEALDHISREIKDLIKKGLFRKLDPALSARAFLGMVVHYCMMQEVYGFKRFFDRPARKVADTFVDIFINGMAKEGGL